MVMVEKGSKSVRCTSKRIQFWIFPQQKRLLWHLRTQMQCSMQVQSCYCYVFNDYIYYIIVVNDRFWFKASSEQFNQSLDRPFFFCARWPSQMMNGSSERQPRIRWGMADLRIWDGSPGTKPVASPVKPPTSGACKIGSIPDSSHGHGDRGAMVFICFHGLHIFSWMPAWCMPAWCILNGSSP